MAINFPSNIQLNAQLPLDTRQVVANSTARLALKYAYPGLVVFEQDTQKLYVAINNNSNTLGWQEVGSTNGRIIHGYYYDGVFYKEEAHTTIIDPNVYSIYIDDGSTQSLLYIYNKKYGESTYQYICVNPLIPDASESVSGIAKLYNSLGTNIDGSCTQKVITDNLAKKVSVTADTSNECLVFTH